MRCRDDDRGIDLDDPHAVDRRCRVAGQAGASWQHHRERLAAQQVVEREVRVHVGVSEQVVDAWPAEHPAGLSVSEVDCAGIGGAAR